MVNGPVYAASKKPKAPKILSAADPTSINDADKVVVVTWAKAKNAKKYQVAIRSDEPQWVKVKTVKKTKKNKKKYSKPDKYKVVAKGKKYIVYQYQYEFIKMGTTKARSYRFTKSPYVDHLAPNWDYVFAVRSVNGKKYSKWSTVAVRTNAGTWDYQRRDKPGETMSLNVNGQPVTLTVGAQCVLPIPNPTPGPVETPATYVVNPDYFVYSYDRASGTMMEYLFVYGTTPNGFNTNWQVDLVNGQCSTVRIRNSHPTYVQDPSTFVIHNTSEAGYLMGSITVTDPNTQAVWTLDGTEPALGQEDKIISADEYPFGQILLNGAPYPYSFKVRGTVKDYGDYWATLSMGASVPSRCEWIKVYNGTQLVYEEIWMRG
ncbi:MAG: hypothetical protein IJI11_01945 [Mogibacterium sp.]|nr:hypothetical protein [Mogibacterium sp.]